MIPFTSLSLPALIEAGGYVLIFGCAFAESGLPFGFIFPGDSLLFTAGFLASAGLLNITILVPGIILAAIAGDSVGYMLGARYGARLFSKPDSLLFTPKHLARTEDFYARYGVRAVILARFVPVVRSFVPIFAGIGSMRYKTFLAYNILGAFLWGAGITLLGFFLGKSIPGSEQYLLPGILLIIVISFLPLIVEIARSWARRSK